MPTGGRAARFNPREKRALLDSFGDCWVVEINRMAGEGKHRMLIVFNMYVDLTFPCCMQNNKKKNKS
jgi:hypothetical protein